MKGHYRWLQTKFLLNSEALELLLLLFIKSTKYVQDIISVTP